MITVVDQQSPWLMPSSTLATTIHSQLGASMIRNGTGRPTSQPATRIRLRPTRSEKRPAKRLASALTTPKRDDEGEDDGRGGQAELLLGQERHDRALQADHAADEGVDEDQQRELRASSRAARARTPGRSRDAR